MSWGDSAYGLAVVPPLPQGMEYSGISAGIAHSVALRSDGSVVAWGRNHYGQSNVPPLPAGLTYVAISAGGNHTLALRSDGSAVSWGGPGPSQSFVPPLPAGMIYIGIGAGFYHSVALRSDGSALAWGAKAPALEAVPKLLPGWAYTGVFAGGEQSLGTAAMVWNSYCHAKANSLGCVPAVDASGAPSAAAPVGFAVRGTLVRNEKPGLLFYVPGGVRTVVPFQCGTLCLDPAGIRRTPARSSGGNPWPYVDCSGVLEIDMNAFAAGAAGGNPAPALRLPGTLVQAQWWGRDQGFAPPCNTMLSDALEYEVGP